MILLIDNYDSFTFNLRRYLAQLGQDVVVWRNDEAELLSDLRTKFDAIVISPGPKAPKDAGHCIEVVRAWSGRLPILGVCLGHQAIIEAFGGRIVRAQKPTHGKTTPMQITPNRLFDGIPSGASFARYHSLIGEASTLPAWLRAVAWSQEQEIMAVEHMEHPTFGVQFHPESILSLDGHRLLANFLIIAGLRPDTLPPIDLVDLTQAQVPETAFEDTPPAVLPR